MVPVYPNITGLTVNPKFSSHLKGKGFILEPKMSEHDPGTQIQVVPNTMFNVVSFTESL